MTRTISAFGDGLDMTRLDTISPEEEARFRTFYKEVKGGLIPAHAFMLEFRPDLLKRHRALAREMTDHENEKYPLVHTLAHLHYYAIVGFGDGIGYEITQARRGGALRSDVLDTLGIAYLHAGPKGMAAVAAAATSALRDWQDDPRPDRFPPHWRFDPAALSTGCDFADPELSATEAAAIRRWYQTAIGEIPPYVALLFEHRPRLLKSYRSRMEAAISGSLPVQAFAWFQLHHAVCRNWGSGIREAILLGRHLGLRSSEIDDAISWGLFYGGPAGLSLTREVARDLLVVHPGSPATIRAAGTAPVNDPIAPPESTAPPRIDSPAQT
jgi:hypothetical protein